MAYAARFIYCASCACAFLDLETDSSSRFLEFLSAAPLSVQILEVVLGYLEHTYDKYVWPRSRLGRMFPGHRSKWVTTGRYVDDLLLISRWLCCDCLYSFPTDVYRSHITFDPADPPFPSTIGNYICKYLDTYLYVTEPVVEFFHCNPNQLYLWAPSELQPVKYRSQPNTLTITDAMRKLKARKGF